MTYTIEFNSNQLTMDICKKADDITSSGMIEEVLPGLVSFHDLDERDVEKAMLFILEHFKDPSCDVAREHYKGCFCSLEYIQFGVKNMEQLSKIFKPEIL